MSDYQHPFHLVKPSSWPLLSSMATFIFFIGFTYFLHGGTLKHTALIVGLSMVILTAIFWWKDVFQESQEKAHNIWVRKGLKFGMILFILSEICIFATFFSSFMRYWLAESNVLTDLWHSQKVLWPPQELHTPDPWTIPLLNTFILLLSGMTTNWAHYEILNNNSRKNAIFANGCTIMLGILFLILQAFEYHHLTFSLSEEGLKAIYSSNFFIITGFHGLHVLVGVIFLIVCQFRMHKITTENHLSFEFAAWYWHFVDIVWIILFALLYVASKYIL